MNWDFFFTIVTAATAVFALMSSVKQIRLSNKQSLFDRRLECYLKIDGLIQLYKDNKEILESDCKDKPIFTVESEFLWLTNNIYLEEIGKTITTPLEDIKHKKFLAKLEELKQLAVEVEFIFKRRVAADISRFIFAYKELLFKMYQYQIILKDMQTYSSDFQKGLEETQKAIDEPLHRIKLVEVRKEIEESYLQLLRDNAMKKIKKQIKLQRESYLIK